MMILLMLVTIYHFKGGLKMKTKEKNIREKMIEEMEDLTELRDIGKKGLKINRNELNIVSRELVSIKKKLGMFI